MYFYISELIVISLLISVLVSLSAFYDQKANSKTYSFKNKFLNTFSIALFSSFIYYHFIQFQADKLNMTASGKIRKLESTLYLMRDSIQEVIKESEDKNKVIKLLTDKNDRFLESYWFLTEIKNHLISFSDNVITLTGSTVVHQPLFRYNKISVTCKFRVFNEDGSIDDSDESWIIKPCLITEVKVNTIQ